MSFRETSPRHYKRLDYKNKKGSNQYQTKRRTTVKGFMTLIVFTSMVGFWGYTQVYAAQPLVSPLPKADIVKNDDVATTSGSSELSPTQIAEYIRTDQEKDKKEAEWKEQQQQFNQAIDTKVNLLGNAVGKMVDILDGLLGGAK